MATGRLALAGPPAAVQPNAEHTDNSDTTTRNGATAAIIGADGGPILCLRAFIYLIYILVMDGMMNLSL